MQLYDPRLRFARDLIFHWLHIRGGALVPADDDLDPRQLLRCFDYLAIADLRLPAHVTIELAGAAISRRFGGDIRRANWLDLVPPRLGDAGARALHHMLDLPCGFYHRFTVARDDAPKVTVETLALPLRHRIASVPDAAIAITSDDGDMVGGLPAGWLSPSARLEYTFDTLVDIGAGTSAES
jgi:hypothetical protein